MTPYKRREVIGDATLYLGDCLEILPTLPKVDAVITDPPYGQNFRPVSIAGTPANRRGLNGGWVQKLRNHGGTVRGDDREFEPNFLLDVAPSVLIWGAHIFSSKLPRGQFLVWDKRVDLPSISLGDGEVAWLNKPGPVRIIRHRWAGLVKEANTEESARARGGEAQPQLHPTQKPIAVMRWCVERASKPGDVVLDPYMGSGSTGPASLSIGRKFIGIEIEPKYFDIACRRIEDAQRQVRMFA